MTNTHSVTEELSPCPFCGNPAHLDDFTDRPVKSWVLRHGAPNCPVMYSEYLPTREAALKIWNTRAQPKPVEPTVAVGDDIKVRIPGETPWATVAHVIAPGIVIARLQAVAAPEHSGLSAEYFLTFQWRNNPYTPQHFTWELGREDEQVKWPRIEAVT